MPDDFGGRRYVLTPQSVQDEANSYMPLNLGNVMSDNLRTLGNSSPVSCSLEHCFSATMLASFIFYLSGSNLFCVVLCRSNILSESAHQRKSVG